jgi:hypothetical protein
LFADFSEGHKRGERMRRLFIFAVLTTCLFISPATAEQKKIKVFVSVPPAFTQYTEEVESYLKRELRDLKDVELVNERVDKAGQFFISVIAAPISGDGISEGVALSYVLESVDLIVHNVNIGQKKELKNMCQQVIAVFDSKFLESYRKK